MKNSIKCPGCGEIIQLPSDSLATLIKEDKEFLSQILSRAAEEISDEAKAQRDRILEIIKYVESMN